MELKVNGMNPNLNDERRAWALVKRIRKANKLAKMMARGGFGDLACGQYLEKHPEAKIRLPVKDD